MAKKKRGHKARGDLPGEYVKRSLVTVTLDTLAPGGRREEEHYIVQTRRLDGRWTVVVEYKGERWVIPNKAVVQVNRQQAAIIKASRSDRGREVADRLLQQAMEADTS